MVFNQRLYVKVFEHNSVLGGFFKNAAEAKSCNAFGRFSILDSLDKYKYGDKYEFLLYYPELETRNVWKQESNPCNGSAITGYEPVLIQETSYWGNGIRISPSSSYTLMDGGVAWWFAIGACTNHGQSNTFPGPGKDIKIAQLWLACGEVINNRVNSNIYKNIFPADTINIDYIDSVKQDTSRNIIQQNGHGLSQGKFVFMDNDGLYKLSCADRTDRAGVDGIVSEVIDDNTFVLQKSGKYPWYDMGWEETTVVYLSDTEPGGIKHYASIQTRIFTPVGLFVGDSIIICPQQSSQGINIREYDNESWVFESYTGQELLDTIKEVYDYYKGGS